MAMVLDAFVSKLAEMLIDLGKEEVEMLLGVPGEIHRLEDTLHTISNVLLDAERKRIQSRAIDDWLKELKDVMYDADDILDLCSIEAEKSHANSDSTSSVRCHFPLLSCFRKTAFVHEVGTRIKILNLRLEIINKRKSDFGLQLISPDKHQETTLVRPKTSPAVESDIVGTKIEEDTKSLVESLMNEDRRGNVLVFAIVGLGGIGKTTLAQKIFDDQKIKDQFPVKMWVCVSQEFDAVHLLRQIIKGAGGNHGDADSRALLEPMVQGLVRGKKFLLVLDDVWTEKVWDGLLRNALQSGDVGSRVLVTTRNECVAKRMKTVHSHPVDKLSSEDSWSLLCKKVVLGGSVSEIQGLKDIGMKIVKKCDGLPLAIGTVGGVLCTMDRTRRAWEGVLESTAWSVTGLPEEVRGALYLSYEELPSHLKQCFLYCSLFPEDSTIRRSHVVPLWISEGFVKPEGELSLEETGEGYYKELVMRSLLQPHPSFFDQNGCRMHDLLRFLAQFLTRDESSIVADVHEFGRRRTSTIKLRRISIAVNEMTTIPDLLKQQKSVRTLLVFNKPRCQLDDLLGSLSCLRVLDLDCSGITTLPDSLGSLIHLRRLNLRGNYIRVLPQAIGTLRNLLFLDCGSCYELSGIPNSVVDLHKLRTLGLHGTAIDGIPEGMDRLQQLDTLEGFRLNWSSAEGWSTLKALGRLSQLRILEVEKIERASSGIEARAAALVKKSKLRELKLHWTPYSLDPIQSEKNTKRIEEVFEEVFEELRPPPSLEKLTISDYTGRKFPTWMAAMASSTTSVALPNLRRLEIKGCAFCDQLPPLGLLPNLEQLRIYAASSVINIGPEFHGSSSSGGGIAGVHLSNNSFPKLEKLELDGLSNWEEWLWEKGAQGMPCLKILELFRCPKLRSLPDGLLYHATALTDLFIYGACSLKAIKNLLSLQKLSVMRNDCLEIISDLPSLESLRIEFCSMLQVVDNVHALQRVALIDYQMNSLPEFLLKGVRLEKLEIGCNVELLKNIRPMNDGLEWSKIQHVQDVYVRSEDGSAKASYSRNPFSFTTNLTDTTTASS